MSKTGCTILARMRTAGLMIGDTISVFVPFGLALLLAALMLDYPKTAAPALSRLISLAMVAWCVFAYLRVARKRLKSGPKLVYTYLVIGTSATLLIGIQLATALWIPHIRPSTHSRYALAHAMQVYRFFVLTRMVTFLLFVPLLTVFGVMTLRISSLRATAVFFSKMRGSMARVVRYAFETALLIGTGLILANAESSIFDAEATLKTLMNLSRFNWQHLALGTCFITIMLLHVAPLLAKVQLRMMRGATVSGGDTELADPPII